MKYGTFHKNTVMYGGILRIGRANPITTPETNRCKVVLLLRLEGDKYSKLQGPSNDDGRIKNEPFNFFTS